ncbi:MAG: nickel pincer cofactor biosynthesis protein LarB [Firmicutes bacterium]|nr:nickel pincer cofactor biosynthesis protein LarB [Bacillota bacterium]
MDKNFWTDLLKKVAEGSLSTDEALKQLEFLPYQDLEFAKIDHHRHIRSGFPEVIFCQGKTPEQTAEIFYHLSLHHSPILATRADNQAFLAVQRRCPEAQYNSEARCITIGHSAAEIKNKYILVVSAGTADSPVAEEAAFCAEVMKCPVKRLFDVGVAGIHRLLNNRESLQNAEVIIVVAGMEGALASVVGGLTDKPVIAVPTSVGYGASFGGLAALLAMLNSCAMGVGVVNIDNGFGAAALARSIFRLGVS